jgi:hypothetical protein
VKVGIWGGLGLVFEWLDDRYGSVVVEKGWR